MHQAAAAADTSQPRLEALRLAQALERAPRIQQRLLNDLLGGFWRQTLSASETQQARALGSQPLVQLGHKRHVVRLRMRGWGRRTVGVHARSPFRPHVAFRSPRLAHFSIVGQPGNSQRTRAEQIYGSALLLCHRMKHLKTIALCSSGLAIGAIVLVWA